MDHSKKMEAGNSLKSPAFDDIGWFVCFTDGVLL